MTRIVRRGDDARRRSRRAGVAPLLALAAVVSACNVAAPSASSSQSVSPSPSASPSPTSAPPRRLSFAVIGDFGTGGTDQRAVAQRMCAWRRKHPFKIVITTGDNIYPNGSPTLFDSELSRPYRCLLRRGVRFHASLGNHDAETDGGDPEVADARFGMAGHNYVIRKHGVRLVIADSNALDRAWLRDALKAKRGDAWTIVVFHFPVYSAGSVHGSTPGYRPSLPRLFRRRGVDLVLNGHDHVFAATKNLRGIRYVVTGGGGAPLYGCTDKSYSATCTAQYHFLYVVAGPDRIRVVAVPPSGKPIYRLSTRGRS